MSALDSRLHKLVPVLTAKERAVLVLGSLKYDTLEEASWRATMPASQAPEFNRYIGLMNGVNVRLRPYVVLVDQLVDKLQLRMAWLVTLMLWEEQVNAIGRAVRVSVQEPITQTEYQARLEAWRGEWFPVGELADVLAGDFDDWSDDDLEMVEGTDDVVVRDAAWDRFASTKEKDLRRLVKAGRLPGRGRGKDLQIRQGDFDDFFGRTSAAVPDNLLTYRVEADAAEVDLERRLLERVFTALDWQPSKTRDELDGVTVREKLTDGLRNTLAACFADCWVQVRAAEMAIDEVAGEFGVDPLRPSLREILVSTSAKLRALANELPCMGVEIQMPEPDRECRELIRAVVGLS